MSQEKDRNYVSVGFWMLALFLTALPCVGPIFVLIMAFAGENESRKNYFRAVILWFLIIAAIWAILLLAGLWPAILQYLEELRKQAPPNTI